MVKSKHSAPDRVMKLDSYPERDKITWIHYLTPCGYIHEVCHKVQFVPSLCDQALFGVLSLTDCVNFSLLLCCQNLGGLVLLLGRFLHFQFGPQPLESLQVATYIPITDLSALSLSISSTANCRSIFSDSNSDLK